MARTAALVLGALLVGGVVGYLIGADDTVPVDRAAARNAPPVVANKTYVPPRPSDSNLGQAIAALPVPTVARGTATITGTVTTVDGAPVAGVKIKAWPRGNHKIETPADDDSLEAHVRRAVERYYVKRQREREAFTSADGGYTLTDLPAGEMYFVMATHDDYRMQAAPGQALVGPLPAGGTYDWLAVRTYRVTVNVRLAGGGEPETASISSEQGSSTHATTWRPDSRVLRVSEGRHRIKVSVADEIHDPATTEVEVGPEQPTAEITLTLLSPPGVRGAVKAIGGLTSLTARILADVPDARGRLLDAGRRARVRHGRYVFRNLAPGRYLLAITYDDRHTLVTRHVVVGNAMGTADFEINEFPHSAFAVVRTLDPEGNPVRDVTFTARRAWEGGTSEYGGIRGILRKDGAWLVPHEKGEGGTFSMAAVSSTFGHSPAIEYEPGHGQPIEIRFAAPAYLHVTLSGYAKSALVGRLTVGLTGVRGERPDERGRVTLGPLAPGANSLWVSVQHDRSNLAAPAIPIELVAGKQRRTVPVPRVYRITVTVPEGIERIRLQHGHARLHATVHNGRVEFTDVPAGACKLQGTNAKPIEFDLKDDRAIAMERTG